MRIMQGGHLRRDQLPLRTHYIDTATAVWYETASMPLSMLQTESVWAPTSPAQLPW